MANLTREELRGYIDEAVARYRATPDDAPPPQLIEAMVDLETGGTFEYDTVDPLSGAAGLGQIMVEGQEWYWFVSDPDVKARWGDVSASRLADPAFNLDVMVYGMNRRQEQGGALTDWYMASASYLGGATVKGFNEKKDSYGTNGREYVAGVQERIAKQWGSSYVMGIDALQPGAVINPLNVFESYYDPDVQYNETNVPRQNAADRGAQPRSAEQIYDSEMFTTGGPTVGDIIGGAAGDVLDWPDQIAGAVGAWLPRIGLFLLGLLALVGAVVIGKR